MSKRRPPPRPSQRTRLLPLSIGGLFVLVGLIILAASWLPVWNDYRQGKRLAAEGVLASGMVLIKSQAHAGSVTVPGYAWQLVDYSVRYRFTTRSGRKLESDAKVTPEQWGLLEERGPIKVRYLPDDAKTNHVSGQKSSESRVDCIIFTVIGVAFTAVGGLIVIVIIRNDKALR